MVNRKNVYVSLLLILFVAGCNSEESSRVYEVENYFVAAHRGFHTVVPENSIASIEKAIRHNIDIVEVDIRVSKDGIPVLMHDETVDRTTNGSGKLTLFDLHELKELLLLHQGEETHHRVPTLEEALEAGNGKIIFDLDLKTTQVEKIIEVVEETGAHESVIFFDSDWEVLEKIHQARPEWNLMPRSYDENQAKEAYKRFKPWAVHVDPSFATPELSRYLQERGSHVWINALGDVDSTLSTGSTDMLENLIQTQSNIIQTDLPLTVKQWLEDKLFSDHRFNNHIEIDTVNLKGISKRPHKTVFVALEVD